MVVTSKHRTHKVMEAAIRELMGAGTPPRFKFKDTYESIEFPSGYTIPAQATLEAKYDELLALEEDIQKTVMEGDLEVGTSNLFVDTETGNVGIGTTSPGRPLEIAADGGGAILNLKRTNAGTGQGALAFVNLNSNVCAAVSASRTGAEGGNLVFYTIPNDTTLTSTNPYLISERMRITSGGNVGIGTESPLEKLDVYGVGRISSDYPRLDLFTTTSRSTNDWGNSTGAAGDYRIYSNGDASDGTKRSLNFDYGQNSVHTTRMCINALGNVGIGTASPGCKLHVNGAICLEAEDIGQFGVDNISDAGNRTNTYIAFGHGGTDDDWAYLRQIGGSNGNHIALDFHDDGDDAGFSIRDVQSTANPDTVTTRFMVERGGNVGIGTTNPTHQLHIGPKDNDHIYLASSNNSYGWTIDTDDQGSGTVPFRIIKRTGGVDSTVLTIKNQDGKIGIGKTNPGYALDVVGEIYASGDVIMFSDERKKTNIDVIPNALEKVLQLRGVTFDKIDDGSRRHTGIIAQEVEKVLPEVVYTAEDGTKSVAYGNMIGLLIEAIKELAGK